MFTFTSVLFILVFYVSGALSVTNAVAAVGETLTQSEDDNESKAVLGPCPKNDMDCLQESVNNVRKEVYEEYELDPVILYSILGQVNDLHYKLFDNQIEGLKECNVENLNFEVDQLLLHTELFCESIDLSGIYETKGYVYGTPLPGNGSYEINTGQYRVTIDAEMRKIVGSDGNTYVNFDSYELTPEALSPITFDFENLFAGDPGQKSLSAKTHKLLHENWKKVADACQEPIFDRLFEKVIRTYNRFLNTQPMEEVFTEPEK